MRVNRYGGEPDLAALVERLYRFPHPSKARRARAEAALLESNPYLRDLDRVAPGTVIVVPEVPEAKVTDESPMLPTPLDLVLAEARRNIGQIQEAVGRRVDRQVEEARAVLESLTHPDWVKLARKDPALRKYRSEATREAKSIIAKADAVKAARRAGLDELSARLEKTAGGESAAQS